MLDISNIQLKNCEYVWIDLSSFCSISGWWNSVPRVSLRVVFRHGKFILTLNHGGIVDIPRNFQIVKNQARKRLNCLVF